MSKRVVTFRVDSEQWEGYQKVADFFGLSPSELLRMEVASVQAATLLKFDNANILNKNPVLFPNKTVDPEYAEFKRLAKKFPLGVSN